MNVRPALLQKAETPVKRPNRIPSQEFQSRGQVCLIGKFKAVAKDARANSLPLIFGKKIEFAKAHVGGKKIN